MCDCCTQGPSYRSQAGAAPRLLATVAAAETVQGCHHLDKADAVTVTFVPDWVAARKPVATICHAARALVEADVLGRKTLTSFPTLQTDIRNAGGTWVDEEVFVCPTDGWTLVTSRKPDDLDAFSKALVDQFA